MPSYWTQLQHLVNQPYQPRSAMRAHAHQLISATSPMSGRVGACFCTMSNPYQSYSERINLEGRLDKRIRSTRKRFLPNETHDQIYSNVLGAHVQQATAHRHLFQNTKKLEASVCSKEICMYSNVQWSRRYTN